MIDRIKLLPDGVKSIHTDIEHEVAYDRYQFVLSDHRYIKDGIGGFTVLWSMVQENGYND